MHPIVYDVAVSLDGYISGLAGDISKFAHDGPVVDDYTARLKTYKTAIVGRVTYEFGYAYGLKAGQNPYPGLKTIVYSKNLELGDDSDVLVQRSSSTQSLHHLKTTSEGPIYLCGGGEFAGWLLKNGLIDRLFLKRAPILYGDGVQLFGGVAVAGALSLITTRTYENGYVLEEFAI